MTIKTVSVNVAASMMRTSSMVVSDQTVKETLSTDNTLSNQAVQSTDVDQKKVPPVKKQSPEERIETQKKPVRVMSHIVRVYNPQGKARTRFMDSNNNVVYQIPTEMVAKLEDQMLDPDRSTSTKG